VFLVFVLCNVIVASNPFGAGSDFNVTLLYPEVTSHVTNMAASVNDLTLFYLMDMQITLIDM